MKSRNLLVLAMLSLGLSLGACQKHEQTPVEKATDKVEDGLNMRDHEKLKDTGEDIKDAAKDAKDSAKEETK